MKTIGDKLRIAREVQNRSINDIAVATRIDVKFLSDIEMGTVPQIPHTYLRAFIADYAREVGLNSAELLRELESAQFGSDGKQISEEVDRNLPAAKIPNSTGSRIKVLFVIFLFVLLGFAGSIYLLHRENTKQSVQEISFSEVIKEQEQKIKLASNPSDSTSKLTASVREDTLILDGVASESVWVRIALDDAPSIEYTIPKFHRKQWKAKKSFLVSLGDASGISFILNGQRLGPLSTIKRPMKNVIINRDALAKLKTKYP